ncbi:MAG: hydrogenase maturation nickel metallochaperone HypA [Candidatus Acidiferrales bacterium]
MHELSIALSIVNMAQEESERRGGVQIQAVHLQLGRLSGVLKEALLSAYEMACHATPLEGSQLLIQEIPIEVYCPKCERQQPVHSIQMFCCAECGTPTPQVVRGKELEVIALEIQE